MSESPRGPDASKVAHASLWTMGGYGASQALRFAGNLVLTRIMFPDVFGLASLVFTFIYGLQMFTDVGTGPAVVQNPRGDEPAFLDTAWTIQAARGGFLFLASCAIAWPVSWFYGQPLLAWLVPAAGIGAIFDGLASMSIHQASRHLRAKWTTALELSTQLLNILTIIGVATLLKHLLGPHDLRLVWAVIAGVVVGELNRLLVSHLLLPGIRHRFRIDPGVRHEIFTFGRWVFLSTLIMFLATQSDRLVFAKMIPLDLLGVYGIAAALGGIPPQLVQRLSSAVLFPAYSGHQGSADFRRIFWKARLPILIAGGTLVSGLLSCGPSLIRLLYDDRYAAAGTVLRFLAAAGWFQMLEATTGAALLATGRVRWLAAGNTAKLVGLLLLLPLGFHLGGFEGALAGLVAADVLKYLASTVGLARHGLAAPSIDAGFTAAVAAVAAGGAAVGLLAGGDPEHPGHLLAFLASGTFAAVPWAVAGLLYWRRRAGPGDAPAVAPAPRGA